MSMIHRKWDYEQIEFIRNEFQKLEPDKLPKTTSWIKRMIKRCEWQIENITNLKAPKNPFD